MKLFKTIIAYLILTALIFDVSGHILIFKKLQKDIHRKIKHTIFKNIPINELEIFSFNIGKSIPGIVWIHSKEFRLNGKMYDIIKKDTIDNNVKFYCVWDKDEESLISKYSNLISGKIRDFESKYSNIPIFTIENYYLIKIKNFINYTSYYGIFNQFQSILKGINQKIDPPPKVLV